MIDVTVKVNGGLFKRNIQRSVRDAMYQEAVDKVGQRMERGGRGLGVQRNTLTRTSGQLDTTITSTRNWPRTRGTSWQRKNIGIAKAMSGRVLRKAAERIVSEMG